MALLAMLSKLAPQNAWQLAAAHYEHGIRGEDSLADARFVEDFCRKRQIPCFVEHGHVPELAAAGSHTLEQAARSLRYEFLERVRQEQGFDYIVTAHHADDQLETFFINLLRGSGIRGLKGMQSINGHVIRPLLDLSRAEIQQYAIENGIKWREDHTNAETQFLRNKIRHELLPVIDSISKEGRASILKSINHLASENELYRELVDEKLFQIVKQDGEVQKTSHLSPPTSQLLFEWLRDYGFNSDQVHFIYEAMNGQPGTSFFSPTHKVTIERDGVELTPICQHDNTQVELVYEQHPNDDNFVIDKSPEVAQLDYDKLTFPLKLRIWQAGDRFYPLGMKGSRLLSDFMKDLKLTTRQKEECQVLTTAKDEIVWVVGRRVDERFKVTDKTKTILKIQMV
jgi:tRNA(Ile)-lysidine synthase